MIIVLKRFIVGTALMGMPVVAMEQVKKAQELLFKYKKPLICVPAIMACLAAADKGIS